MPNRHRHNAFTVAGQATILFVLLVSAARCAGPQPKTAAATGELATSLTLPAPPPTPELAASRVELYARLLPGATRFEPRAIPPQMVLAADRGNETYVIARAAAGAIVGYLRDVAAPVIPGRTTDVDLLDVTLVFTASRELTTLVAHRPLLKSGGQPLTAEEHLALVRLVRAPPAELLAVPRPDDAVDAVTGATRDELRAAVVAGAAYTSRRLASLVQETRTLIEQAPLVWDQQRLQAVLEPPATEAALAEGLGELLPTLSTLEVRRQAYQGMAQSYARALADGQPPIAAVEVRLLAELQDDPERGSQLAQACYQLARRDLRRAVVDHCLPQLAKAPKAEPALRARLAGTVLALRGEASRALPELRKAAATFDRDRDPELHLRLAMALGQSGSTAEACTSAQALFRRHPLLPGVEAALATCAQDTATLVATLRDELRAALLATRQTVDLTVPSLSLENDRLQTVDWAPASGQVTVLVVFSTWCPHCRVELPRVNAFYEALAAQPGWRDRVQVVGIRTAVERERLPWATFLAQTAPSFPILTDSAWSLAFTQLTRTLGLRAELPTLLVIDPSGVVRFRLEAGDHRDTARELSWAVAALLGE